MQDQNFLRLWSARLVCVASLLCAVAARAQVSSQSFSNANLIEIAELGLEPPYAATPYPSAISVSGVTGAVIKITATLRSFSHEFASDVDILLVGPGGQKSVLMSDAGGSDAVADVTLTFDDAQPGLASTGQLVSGSFGPRDYGLSFSDSYPSPAPPGPYTASLSVFNNINPNGIWSLYVVDDFDDDGGSIDDGWTITLTTQSPVCCETPPVLDVTLTGSNAVLRWPASATGYVIVAKSTLDPALSWNPIANPVITTNGTNTVTIPASSGNRFFRLRK